MNYNKLDGDQKTLITVIVLFMAFIYILISLPSENVGVYMHFTTHKWAVLDSNGVAIEKKNGNILNESKVYHCVLMERSNGEDQHIESFAKDNFDSAKALWLELKQVELDNPKATESNHTWLVGILSAMSMYTIIFFLAYFFPQGFKKAVDIIGKKT